VANRIRLSERTYARGVLDSVAVLYLGVPSIASALWLGHAGWSWHRPARRSPLGVVLLVALPVAAALACVAFGHVDDPPRSMHDPLPPGDHGDLRLGLLIVFFELVGCWLVVLALEVVLVPVRSLRRHRVADAGRAPGSDGS
jgi:hypothetical protein